MALNSSGPISLGGATAGQSINLENGFSATAQVSLNDTAVRNLAGVASGAITMPTNFYGKANRVSLSYTFSSNTANASLNLSGISGYSAGKSDITVTVNGGVYLYSTSTGSYALNITGGTTGDTLTIVNNGYIMGQGGNGGGRNSGFSFFTPTSGGPALNLASIGISSATVTNTSGYIGGGGGGGSTGGSGGGGGGAGAGGGGSQMTNGGLANGGSGGGVGSSGGNGTTTYSLDPNYGGINENAASGGGGGRIMPGTGGSQFSSGYFNGVGAGGGAGGGGSVNTFSGKPSNTSDGGSAGAAGVDARYSNGNLATDSGGGGGGWGASGGISQDAGASGGKAINTGGKSITWTGGSSSSSRAYGAVS